MPQGQMQSQEPAEGTQQAGEPTDPNLITIEVEEEAGQEEKPREKTTDDLYDEEYGAVADPVESEAGEGEEASSGKEEEPEGVPAKEEESELERLRRENEELRRKAEPKKEEPAPAEEEASESQDEDPAPDPADYEFGDVDAKFIADTARWNTRQELRAHEARQMIRTEVERLESGWKEATKASEIAELYPDFDEKVTKGADREEWKCSAPMAVLIKRSAIGPHVAYELATNPAEAARLAALNPQELLLEFGRLEGRVTAVVEGKKAKAAEPAPKPRASKAPEPPAHRSRGAGGKFVTDADALYSKMLKEMN